MLRRDGSLGGIGGEAAPEQLTQLRREVCRQIGAARRACAGQRFEQHDADCKNVRACIDG